MKGLTAKEEEIMGFFWEKGPLFVKEMLAFYEEPKPHFNTLSTIVRGLEDKGFLSHHTYGNTYQYYAVVSEEDFRKRTLKNVISKYFNNSYLGAVSSLVKEEDISLEELKQLIQEVEKGKEWGNWKFDNSCLWKTSDWFVGCWWLFATDCKHPESTVSEKTPMQTFIEEVAVARKYQLQNQEMRKPNSKWTVRTSLDYYKSSNSK